MQMDKKMHTSFSIHRGQWNTLSVFLQPEDRKLCRLQKIFPRFSELEFFTYKSDPKLCTRKKVVIVFYGMGKSCHSRFFRTRIVSDESWWKSFRSVDREFDHSIKKFIVHARVGTRRAEFQELSHRSRFKFDVTRVFPIACRSFIQLQS